MDVVDVVVYLRLRVHMLHQLDILSIVFVELVFDESPYSVEQSKIHRPFLNTGIAAALKVIAEENKIQFS